MLWNVARLDADRRALCWSLRLREPVQVEVELERRKMGILSWRDMNKWDKSAAKQKSEWGAGKKKKELIAFEIEII